MHHITLSAIANYLPGRCATRSTLSATRIKAKVLKLLRQDHKHDSAIAIAAVDLAQKLVAMKQLFPHMLLEQDTGLPTFDIHAAIQDFQINKNCIARQLHDIAPSLAEESALDSFWQIVEAGGNLDCAKRFGQDCPLRHIDPDSAPSGWPLDIMLFVLHAGNWSKIDLNNAMLANADLRQVQWPGVNLRGANLNNVLLARSNLSNGDLTGCNLTGSDLSYVNLRYANLTYITANRVILKHADMTGVTAYAASFAGASFEGVNLRDTDFRYATLNHAAGIACAPGSDFNDALLNGTEISLRKASLDIAPHDLPITAQTVRERETFCEHQLMALSSINEKYNGVYVKAVWDLIKASLPDSAHYFPVSTFLMRSLMTQKRCWTDPQLGFLIKTDLLLPLLAVWNERQRNDADPLLEDVLNYLSTTEPPLEWPLYCGAMHQLLNVPATSPIMELQNDVRRLFLRHPVIAEVAAALDTIEEGLSGLSSIFITDNGDGALTYENAALRDLSRGIGSPYSCYQFRRDARGRFDNETLHDLYAMLHACSMPLALYNITAPSQVGIDLIRFILNGSAYQPRFAAALTRKTLPPENGANPKQRIPLAADIPLTAHFRRFCKGEPGKSDFRIRLAHAEQLWLILEKAIGPLTESAANGAKLLLCIGALFTRYSSASIFGTENDSPISLRYYALANINRAHKLDPSLLNQSHHEIVQSLMGAKGVGQCSNVLAGKISTLILEKLSGDPTLATYFKAIYPQAWI